MKDSRQLLRSIGLGALRTIAGLFALSWMGIVLFPMTLAGLFVLFLSLAWLAILYRRNFPVRRTIVALLISGVAIFTANIASISRFGGPVYLFSCSALDISCARVTGTKAFGRPILIVPIWTPKRGFFRYVLGEREKTYFPSVLRAGGRAILHAPLEEQALQQAVPWGRQGRLGYALPVNLPYSELSLEPGKTADELEINLSSQTGLQGIELDSALSNSVPGQFSIPTAGDPGTEEWRRLAFSNETIRAVMTDPAASVVKELEREAARTGLIEDFVRYSTIKLALNRGFYANMAGAGQRLFELRSAIRKADADGDFRIAADLPWNRAFIMQSLETMRDLSRYILAVAPERRRRLADGGTLSVRSSDLPWKQEWEWLGDKGRSIWATADPEDRFGKAMVSNVLDGSLTAMDDFFTKFDQLDPPDRERLRGREIFGRGAAFEHSLAEWLAEDPNLKPQRVAVMGRVIMESTMRLVTTVMGGGLGELDSDDPAQRIAMFKRVRAARAQLATNDARSRLLVDHAATEFQRLQLLSGKAVSFDLLLEMFEDAIACGPTEADCERAARDYWRGYVRTIGSSSLILSMILESATKQDPSGRRFAAQLIGLMEKVAPPMTTAEFDQAVAPALMLAVMSEEPALRNFLPQICAAADGHSRRLLSEPDSDRRIFLHEGAILLALACDRSWDDSHRLALARNGLDPGPWVLLIQQRALARRRTSD
jgi:hypothetical protein